jgi:hypothetical protein
VLDALRQIRPVATQAGEGVIASAFGSGIQGRITILISGTWTPAAFPLTTFRLHHITEQALIIESIHHCSCTLTRYPESMFSGSAAICDVARGTHQRGFDIVASIRPAKQHASNSETIVLALLAKGLAHFR